MSFVSDLSLAFFYVFLPLGLLPGVTLVRVAFVELCIAGVDAGDSIVRKRLARRRHVLAWPLALGTMAHGLTPMADHALVATPSFISLVARPPAARGCGQAFARALCRSDVSAERRSILHPARR